MNTQELLKVEIDSAIQKDNQDSLEIAVGKLLVSLDGLEPVEGNQLKDLEELAKCLKEQSEILIQYSPQDKDLNDLDDLREHLKEAHEGELYHSFDMESQPLFDPKGTVSSKAYCLKTQGLEYVVEIFTLEDKTEVVKFVEDGRYYGTGYCTDNENHAKIKRHFELTY